MNLGNYQPDGVVCDLTPHDLSILLHWLDRPVLQVPASARNIYEENVPETAFIITLTFEGGMTANVQVSWLAPRKIRQMMIVGSRRMISYDDTFSDEPVRLYDRDMEFSTPESFGEYRLTYRSGDVIIPRVEPAEPLAPELQDFARAMLTARGRCRTRSWGSTSRPWRPSTSRSCAAENPVCAENDGSGPQSGRLRI